MRLGGVGRSAHGGDAHIGSGDPIRKVHHPHHQYRQKEKEHSPGLRCDA
jgi:hypothetical protein